MVIAQFSLIEKNVAIIGMQTQSLRMKALILFSYEQETLMLGSKNILPLLKGNKRVYVENLNIK